MPGPGNAREPEWRAPGVIAAEDGAVGSSLRCLSPWPAVSAFSSVRAAPAARPAAGWAPCRRRRQVPPPTRPLPRVALPSPQPVVCAHAQAARGGGHQGAGAGGGHLPHAAQPHHRGAQREEGAPCCRGGGVGCRGGPNSRHLGAAAPRLGAGRRSRQKPAVGVGAWVVLRRTRALPCYPHCRAQRSLRPPARLPALRPEGGARQRARGHALRARSLQPVARRVQRARRARQGAAAAAPGRRRLGQQAQGELQVRAGGRLRPAGAAGVPAAAQPARWPSPLPPRAAL